MKITFNKIAFIALLSTSLVACTQYADEYQIEVEKPSEITDMEYLNSYDVLKNYVNYEVSPNFKLGASVQSTDYIQKGVLYQVVNSNFVELTAGNQMKYNTIVADDGTMDFTNVTNFIDAASAVGLSIYGHTLCWHSQQRANYLNGLIAPIIIPGEEPEGGVVETLEWVDMLEGGDFENGSNSTIQKGNNATFEIVEEADGNHILVTGNTEVRTNVWDAQLLFVIPDDREAMVAGETYRLQMKIKSDNGSSFNAIRYMAYIGKYLANATPNTFATTTEWSDISIDFVIPANADQARVMGLCFGKVADNFYIDDLTLSSLQMVESGGATPDTEVELTDEQKFEVISGALETWIQGMMEACNGYVTSWDVVNEPMDDSNAYALKSGVGVTSETHFYWQDYLGKDYARYAVEYARKYGGDDLLLFVNDYNLEAVYNSNNKCRGLIEMIEYWESDGVTRIDGIGTQMHINLNLDAEYQAKVEECVVTMFELLAESGKLIKISELDMGVRSGDTTILNADTTEEMHLAMAQFYEFIVTKYFEIIPVAQQYGITQWCVTDSATNSSWKAGEPSGLWTEQYNRKHAYASFANGLASAK